MQPITDTISTAPAVSTEPLNGTEPFALIARHGRVEYLTGDIVDVDRLCDIPLHDSTGRARQVLALVPFGQIRERGYHAPADGTPLRCLLVTESNRAPADLMDRLPATPVTLHNAGFTTSDADYADTVSRVISDEIGTGQGANFVIRRDFTAHFTGSDRTAALGFFRALLAHERGSYWTFCIVAGDVVLVGASPEAHVRMTDGNVTMNPISGTLRHDPAHTPEQHHDALMDFLGNQKETEELFMVVDEEMKMMSAVCPGGGRIAGPYLKPMSRLTHTEYELHGRTERSPTAVLRETMFAPTVTGSPMQNACSVITRYEATPRGYYSGVAALFTPNAAGGHDLDAPILIRTATLHRGRLCISAGATLVRHSNPDAEAAETSAKVSGVLAAIGVGETAFRANGSAERSRTGVGAGHGADPDAGHSTSQENGPGARLGTKPAADGQVARLLAARNTALAGFWMHRQIGAAFDAEPSTVRSRARHAIEPPSRRPFAGRTALVVDAEDRFTTMLAHQLRHLGLNVTVEGWDAVSDSDVATVELLIAGPGPGDPRLHGAGTDPRMARVRRIIETRLRAHSPLLAVCLSHQLLCQALGIDVIALAEPRQGRQLLTPYFGAAAQIGYYNTFTGRVAPGTIHTGGAEVAADPDTGDVFGLRGVGFASVQGHLESVLSHDGLTTLTRMLAHVLG